MCKTDKAKAILWEAFGDPTKSHIRNSSGNSRRLSAWVSPELVQSALRVASMVSPKVLSVSELIRRSLELTIISYNHIGGSTMKKDLVEVYSPGLDNFSRKLSELEIPSEYTDSVVSAITAAAGTSETNLVSIVVTPAGNSNN
jgi:hypothetical protein